MPQTPLSSTSARDNGATLFTTDEALFDRNSVRYDYSSLIDETLWNKSFPYQLVVLKVSQGLGLDPNTGQATRNASYSIYNSLIFTLPVNPESLTISMPFAISVSATLGGVVEQHGGAPFRLISFSGTFGVVSSRPSASKLQAGKLNDVGGIFAGTVQAIQNVRTNAKSTGGGERFNANLSSEIPGGGDGDIPTHSTGYYQFRSLQRFLESYAEAKKTADGKDLRLALFIWKDAAAYLVTPQAFDVTATAASPFERKYSLRLQAWRRVDPSTISTSPVGATNSSVSAASSFTLNKAYTLVSNAIRTSQAVTNTLKAVRHDAAKVFNVMRQVALFCASVGGIVKTALALPASIRADFESATRESWDIIQGAFDGLDPNVKKTTNQVNAEVAAFNSGITTTTPTLRQALLDDEQSDFQDLIKPDALNLSQKVRSVLDDHIGETSTMTSDDFRAAAELVFSMVADYSDLVGLNDSTYDRVKGRTPKPQIRNATLDDFRSLHSLVTAASAIQTLVVNAPSRIPITTVEYIAGLANANGIAMRVPRSKFAVPFPYSGTLERLAEQYLGDPARWMEIAELNDLKAPYVDEEGVTQPLVTNGSGNLLNLADAQGLYTGQFVSIWSDVVIWEKRRVVSVKQLGPVQWQVTLDGINDLDKFKLSEHSAIQWFRAGTVNSQQVIYIPSDSPSNPDILRYVPQAEDFNRILTAGDVDGMLTETGDAVITPDGDWPPVYGYAALVQWARTALNTPLGALSMHPDFGLDADIGQSLADSSAQDILKSVRATFRLNPSFTGVTAALVRRAGPTTRVTLELGVRGVDSLLPLTFDVKS